MLVSGQGAPAGRGTAGRRVAQGHRNELLDGTVPKLGIAAAAEAAGFSERQRKTALKLGAKDEDEFEALIESYNPPTITELAEGNGPKPFRNTGDENWYTPRIFRSRARGGRRF